MLAGVERQAQQAQKAQTNKQQTQGS